MSSKNLEISPCSEAKVSSRARQREANRKLFRPWTKTKRMPFLKQENSATPIQLRFKELCGGFCPYTSVSEQETKVVSALGWRSAPAAEWWPRSLGLVGRARNEDSTCSGEKTPKSVPTKDLCHQYTARRSVSFYKKFHSHQPVEMNASESPFYLAAVSGIINAQMKKFGMWRHPGLGKK